MSKIILRGDTVPHNAKIKFIDKRTTIKEEIDGHITYYDLTYTMMASGHIPNRIRAIMYKHITQIETFYTVKFNKDDENIYINTYTERR